MKYWQILWQNQLKSLNRKSVFVIPQGRIPSVIIISHNKFEWTHPKTIAYMNGPFLWRRGITTISWIDLQFYCRFDSQILHTSLKPLTTLTGDSPWKNIAQYHFNTSHHKPRNKQYQPRFLSRLQGLDKGEGKITKTPFLYQSTHFRSHRPIDTLQNADILLEAFPEAVKEQLSRTNSWIQQTAKIGLETSSRLEEIMDMWSYNPINTAYTFPLILATEDIIQQHHGYYCCCGHPGCYKPMILITPRIIGGHIYSTIFINTLMDVKPATNIEFTQK